MTLTGRGGSGEEKGRMGSGQLCGGKPKFSPHGTVVPPAAAAAAQFIPTQNLRRQLTEIWKTHEICSLNLAMRRI